MAINIACALTTSSFNLSTFLLILSIQHASISPNHFVNSGLFSFEPGTYASSRTVAICSSLSSSTASTDARAAINAHLLGSLARICLPHVLRYQSSLAPDQYGIAIELNSIWRRTLASKPSNVFLL